MVLPLVGQLEGNGWRRGNRSKERGEGGEMTDAMAPRTQWSALDRCDGGGAQAYVRVGLPGGGELLFCAHHGRQHGEALARIATEIQDETDRLSPGKAESPSR